MVAILCISIIMHHFPSVIHSDNNSIIVKSIARAGLSGSIVVPMGQISCTSALAESVGHRIYNYATVCKFISNSLRSANGSKPHSMVFEI